MTEESHILWYNFCTSMPLVANQFNIIKVCGYSYSCYERQFVKLYFQNVSFTK